MLLENVFVAASIKRRIEENESKIKEIEDIPLASLMLQRVHGRSVEVKLKDEQTGFAIKQMLVLGLRAKIAQDEAELNALL